MPIQALRNGESKVLGNTENGNGWVKHFEGTSWGHTVIQTSDGGYLVGGGTGYTDDSDALLIKTDSEGNLQWETTFRSLSGWDAFEGLVEASDGGFVASGTKGLRGFLVKVDINGDKVWEKTYGGTTSGYCIDVRQTDDNGFILTGIFYSEPRSGWLIKTDSEGNEIWSKTYGGENPVTCHTVRITDDGGFIMPGWEDDPEGLFPLSWVVKTDASGNVEWENFYDSCNNFHSGVQTSDGGYMFAGGASSVFPLNIKQIILVKTDAEGNEVWSKDFGTPIFQEVSMWVEETSDGGCVVIGDYMGLGTLINFIQTGHFFPLYSQIWLIKTDSDGNLEWDSKVEAGFGRCVKQTSDGGYILTGQRGSYNNPEGVLLIKTDENGNIG